MTSLLLLIVAGIGIGAFAGMFGLGGGVLIVPLLLWLGHNIKVATGTSLAIIMLTAIAGTLSAMRYQQVDWRIVLAVSIGSIIGAYFIGVPLKAKVSNILLRRAFGVLLIIMALRVMQLGTIDISSILKRIGVHKP